MLEYLRETVYKANMQLPALGLVLFTWGNVSGMCPDSGLMVIKPSGVPYDKLTPGNMIIVDQQGKTVWGEGNPSSDTATHLRLYRAFPGITGVVHTHSSYATAFAQAGICLSAYGTTHADYFHGPVPCTRALTEAEINGQYELETGNVIVEAFESLDPMAIPGVLVKNHGPFTWGTSPSNAVYNAAVLEECAKMAWVSRAINPGLAPVPQALLDRHYNRKHGPGATYGNKPR